MTWGKKKIEKKLLSSKGCLKDKLLRLDYIYYRPRDDKTTLIWSPYNNILIHTW